MKTRLTLLACTLAAPTFAADGFMALFNGRDLTGWDGDPRVWRVENGVVIGTCSGSDALANNPFLI